MAAGRAAFVIRSGAIRSASGGPAEHLWSRGIRSTPQENLLRLQAWGELTADGLIGLLNRAQADPQYRPEMNALADYREANGEWDYSEIQKLRDYILQCRSALRGALGRGAQARLAGRRRPRADRDQRGRRRRASRCACSTTRSTHCAGSAAKSTEEQRHDTADSIWQAASIVDHRRHHRASRSMRS